MLDYTDQWAETVEGRIIKLRAGEAKKSDSQCQHDSIYEILWRAGEP